MINGSRKKGLNRRHRHDKKKIKKETGTISSVTYLTTARGKERREKGFAQRRAKPEQVSNGS